MRNKKQMPKPGLSMSHKPKNTGKTSHDSPLKKKKERFRGESLAEMEKLRI